MIGPLSYLDIGLLVICFVSGLLAMYRGLTREVLSILSWALAAAATLYFVLFQKPVAEQLAAQYDQNVLVIQGGIGVAIFVIVLIIVHFITLRFSDSVLDSRVGMIDRILGFGFGAVRGFLLVVIAFLFFAFLAEEKTYPVWVKESRFLPYVEQAGQTIQSMLADALPEKLQIPGLTPDAPAGTEEPAGTEQSG